MSATRHSNYTGRFAPSPTGPLHLGSLLAAMGSYLSAKAQGGRWLLRMEDLDPPREVAGAADDILRTLERWGLHWDGEVVYQSRRQDAYRASLERLRDGGQAYACGCSRKEILQEALPGLNGPIYPGFCRQGLAAGKEPRALRLFTPDHPITFEDAIQGEQSQNIQRESGDFVLLRADGFYAYHLAVVIDDAEQGITEVVRGADLLHTTPLHISLQQALGLTTPAYAHLPVLVNAQGEKLSKQTGATALPQEASVPLLISLLEILGQQPPAELADGDLDECWRWAIANWRRERVPARGSVDLPRL